MSISPTIDLHAKAPDALMLLAVTAIVGISFFLVEHDYSLSRPDLLEPEGSNIELSAQEGHLQRRVGFALLLGTGLACLVASRRQPYRVWKFLASAQLFCLGWCVASIAWSADPSLTIRRMGSLLCFCVAAIGVGRCFTFRQLCLMSITTCAAYVLIALAGEVLQGEFQPNSATYRFMGHVHPNLQASFCATICLGSFCMLDRRGSPRYVWLGIAILALAALVLTKSRTATIALFAGSAVIAIYRLSARQIMMLAIGSVWLLSLAVLLASVAGIDVQRAVVETVLIGRTDDAMSLTGRIPLWKELLAVASDRILIGFGSGAFWTPKHLRIAAGVVGSGISHAHCAYVETILNVGIVGLAAYLTVVCATIRECLIRCRIDSQGGILFLAAILPFALVHACTEALFVMSSVLPFFAAACLAHLTFHARTYSDQREGRRLAPNGEARILPRGVAAEGADA
jgi:O-antigen ligase